MLPDHFFYYVLAGFVAQIIDGALGMAYGVTAASLFISFGVPPAATSATVHAAECFTRIPVRPFMVLVGVLVVTLSARNLLLAFHLI